MSGMFKAVHFVHPCVVHRAHKSQSAYLQLRFIEDQKERQVNVFGIEQPLNLLILIVQQRCQKHCQGVIPRAVHVRHLRRKTDFGKTGAPSTPHAIDTTSVIVLGDRTLNGAEQQALIDAVHGVCTSTLELRAMVPAANNVNGITATLSLGRANARPKGVSRVLSVVFLVHWHIMRPMTLRSNVLGAELFLGSIHWIRTPAFVCLLLTLVERLPRAHVIHAAQVTSAPCLGLRTGVRDSRGGIYWGWCAHPVSIQSDCVVSLRMIWWKGVGIFIPWTWGCKWVRMDMVNLEIIVIIQWTQGGWQHTVVVQCEVLPLGAQVLQSAARRHARSPSERLGSVCNTHTLRVLILRILHMPLWESFICIEHNPPLLAICTWWRMNSWTYLICSCAPLRIMCTIA